MRGLGLESKCALVTDGKISGFAKGPFICQVSPEAAEGGPLAVVRDGDMIELDVPNRKLNLLIPEDELQERLQKWTPPLRLESLIEKHGVFLVPKVDLDAFFEQNSSGDCTFCPRDISDQI